MTETTPATPEAATDEAALAELAALPKRDRDELVKLGVDGRAALAELVAGGADPAPAEFELVKAGDGELAEVVEVAKPKGRGMARPTGGTVTDRARRAEATADPAPVVAEPAEVPAAPSE